MNRIKTNDIVLPGMQIDLDEAWRKLIERQFGDHGARGFAELIQNAIDSYNGSVPFNQREISIVKSDCEISILDKGTGLSRAKLKLVTQLGGTDKSLDRSKIGCFGVGFFSMFNPYLGVERITIITSCEDQVVALIYKVEEQGKMPKIETEVIEKEIDFSTKITVRFNNKHSAKDCARYANSSLFYFPCKSSINGIEVETIWNEAINKGHFFFENSHCNGFIREAFNSEVTMLCKYEKITKLPYSYFVNPYKEAFYNLKDYCKFSLPYVKHLNIVLNAPNIDVTISRDSFYLNYNFINVVHNIRDVLYEYLNKRFKKLWDEEMILKNLYALKDQLKLVIDNKEAETPQQEFLLKLANEKVFKVTGHIGKVSLKDLRKRKKDNLPMFYTSSGNNLRFLGGAFKNNGVIMPRQMYLRIDSAQFWDDIFNDLVGESIDLDSLPGNNTKLKELVERGVIAKDSLNPKCDFVGEKHLSQKESDLLYNLQLVLQNSSIKMAIEKSLFIPVKSIQPIFFSVESEGAFISTGLFGHDHQPINDDFISNFSEKEPTSMDHAMIEGANIILGLRKDHPLIQYMLSSNDSHKEYYLMTYVAHELALCQKLLAPDSVAFHRIKEQLASDIRKALMNQIIEQTK